MRAKPSIIVRPARASDLQAIIVLEKDSASAAHWSEAEYARACREVGDRIMLVAESSSRAETVVGFLLARVVDQEWDLENIVVRQTSQGQGIGSHLLSEFLDIARREHGASVFLEVRASNGAAIALYTHAGFQQEGIRKSYYSRPAEDAILFSLSLKNSS